jgi:serine O-acetyltransferase
MTSGESNVSAVIPDWSREEKTWFSWQPSRSLLASFRSYQRNANSVNPLRIVIKKFAVLRHRFWSIVTGADIPLNCQIGGGLLLPHPNGVVIHPGSTIGPNCLIFQQVTLGDRNGGVPQLGGHVDIGAGAKIIGQITLSNHSAVGANAVVLLDVPENHIAIGVPAKVYPRS